MKLTWQRLAPLALALSLGVTPVAALAQDNTAITIATFTEPDTLDPCENGHAAMSLISKNNISETLADRNPETGELTPRLALSWELIDADTWRVHLREGVKFTDGTPFNADAVIFSIKRAMRQDEFTCSVVTKAFTTFKLTAEAVDEYTVDITADRPAPILHLGFAVYPMMSPSTDMNTLTRDPVGTGAYKLKEWTSGIQIVLERNPDYWGEQPEVSQVTYVFRNEPAVRAAMVETGEADIALEITEQDADNPETDYSYFNTETTWLRFDDRFEPMSDVRVREAMALSIDREAMLGSVISKDSILASQMPGPSIDGFNPDIPQFPYDPDRARQLLAEAAADGVPVDTPIRFLGRIGVFANAEEVMEVITQMVNAVGFNVSLEMMERARHAEYQARPYPEDVGPNINLLMSDNDRGDASFGLFNFHSAGNQSTTYTHPKLDAMIDEGITLTGAERTKAFQELLTYVHDNAVIVPLFYMVSFARVSDRIDWVPSAETSSALVVQRIHFKK
jgi:peptide/nickel transport system substrate-binding protein